MKNLITQGKVIKKLIIRFIKLALAAHDIQFSYKFLLKPINAAMRKNCTMSAINLI